MDKNTSIGAIAGVGLVLVIAFVFALFPAQSDDTIFFIQKDGSTPEPCTGNVGLVLAQNLTDLCDVTIISPSTNQIIKYNGSQWVNVASTTFNDTTTCNNIGVGNAFVCVEGTNVDLRSLLAGTGIIVSNDTNTITITNTLPESTQCINVGSDLFIVKNSTNGNCFIRSLTAGIFEGTSGIDFDNSDPDTITIFNVLPENTTASNLGSSSSLSEGIFASEVGDNLTFKRLLEGTSITLSSNSTHITITNTAPDDTVCANVGTGTIIYKNGECNFKTLVGSADISITNTTNTVVIDYNGTAVTSVSGTSPIVSSGGTTPAISCPTCLLTTNSWVIVANITATNAATTMSSGTITAYKYYNVQVHMVTQTSTSVWGLRFNSDSGTNYDCRGSSNNGADTTGTGLTTTNTVESISNGATAFYDFQFDSFSANRKSIIYHITESAAAGSAPDRRDGACQWTNTSSQITTIEFIRSSGTGTLTTAANMVVLGHN